MNVGTFILSTAGGFMFGMYTLPICMTNLPANMASVSFEATVAYCSVPCTVVGVVADASLYLTLHLFFGM